MTTAFTVLAAMATVLAVWAVYGLALTAIGLLVRRGFDLRNTDAESLFSAFWLGFATVIGGLQIWHLRWPIQWPVLLVLAPLCVVGLALHRRELGGILARARRDRWLLLALLAVGAWLSWRALGWPLNYDTGLYHLNAIRWIRTYGVVPGLGNLHGRLAFNESYFLYAALIEAGSWSGSARHFANGLLLASLFARAGLALQRIFSRRRWGAEDVFFALLLAPLVQQAVGINLSSPSPDLAVFALGIVISGQLLSLFAAAGGSDALRSAVVTVATLAIAGVTIKLSFAGFVLGAMVVLAVGCWRRWGEVHARAGASRLAIGLTVVTVLLLGPWVVRGIILSGYVAYPLTVGAAAVEWRVPEESALIMQTWIRSWARAPGKFNYDEVLASWDWLDDWVRRVLEQHRGDVLLPVALALVAAVLALVLRPAARSPAAAHPTLSWLLLIPVASSIVFWSTSAPHPRFLGAAAILAAPMILVIAVGKTPRGAGIVYGAVAVSIALAVIMLAIDGNPANVRPAHPLDTVVRVNLRQLNASDGLVLYAPAAGDQCWDARLPCTPYPNLHLRLRHSGDLGDGFVSGPTGISGVTGPPPVGP